MAVAAVADEVDDHVLLELLAELVGQAGDLDHGFRIVAVHVEDRRVDHLGEVGAVQRGAGVFALGRGEADLIVDHQVQGAADGEATGLRHLQQLHVDALACEGGVAVDQHGQRLLAGGVAAAALACVHRAGHDRVDDLEVRRVEGQRDVHAAIGRLDVGREAHVVLHVAGVDRAVVVLELAFELVEELRRGLAEDVDQHVEAAAVGHADHDFLDAVVAGGADDVVDHRDQAVAAFEREALLADVLGVQVALEAFGGRERFEHADLLVLLQAGIARGLFQARVDPRALLVVGDVHELGADGAGVDLLERGEQVAQLQALAATGEGASVELGVEVGVGQAVEGEAEIGGVDIGLGQAQRVELGGQVTTRTVGGEQAEYAGLLARVGVVDRPGHGGTGGPALFLRGLDAGDGFGMRNIARLTALEGLEIGIPFGRDRAGIGQPGFVDLLYVIGVSAGELGRFGKLADQVCAHVTTGTREGRVVAGNMWGRSPRH